MSRKSKLCRKKMLLFWWWNQQAVPNLWYLCTILNGIICQEMEVTILAVRISNASISITKVVSYQSCFCSYSAVFVFGVCRISGAGGRAYWVWESGEWWVFYLLGTSVRQGLLCLKRRREGLDQTRCCISDSLVTHRLQNPPANTMHCSIIVRLCAC